ncbi:MAG: lytic transglycosylase domain-containing protein [Clostridia bacterium]|nr:lytic transglycosylase domain-containing protein [Clostridia bacterium]
MSEYASRCSKIAYKTLAVIVGLFWLAFFSAFGTLVVLKTYVYPLGFRQEIFGAAEEFDVDPALVFAVVKTESGFDEKAVSTKGAEGLMQITPSTGEFIAEKLDVNEYDLAIAADNVRFGTYYLKYLSEKFYGLKEIAAAYNAGEGTVKGWLKNAEYSSDGIRLTVIPYRETAEYVEKISKSLQIYKKLYGKLLDKK